MKNIQRLSSIGLTFLLAIMMIFSPLTVRADEAKDYTELVQAAIDGASANMIREGVNSEWQAIGLVRAGKEVPAQYINTFKGNIESQITNGLNSGRIKITDIERLAMAAVVIGKNPLDVEGHNLIDLIYNSPNRGESDTMTFQGNNGPIFALIALDTDSFEVPKDARWTRERLVQYLLEQQNANGSWSLFGTSASYDITAMAIIALGNYKQDVTVLESIQKAASFLSESQSVDAGFNDPWNGGVSLETAAQVMIGLTTAGIDPLGPKFTKENGNLLDHILSFLADDGGFKHLPGDSKSNGMATEQGLQALVAYQLYESGEGRLYDFSKKDIVPEEPEEPEIPKEVIEIEYGKQVTVNKEAEITIKDSETKLKLPSDLPAGTKLTIHIPDKKDNPYQGIQAAGDIINFEFEYPVGKDKGTESYRLSMGVNDGVDFQKTGIYYFNELTKQWQYVGGWGSAKDGLITIDVDHFSTYGVFTDTDGPTAIQIFKEKTTSDSITLGLSGLDPSGIAKYIIYRDGKEIAVVKGDKSEFIDANLESGKTYEYTIVAIDELGNESTGESISVITAIDTNKGKNPGTTIVDINKDKNLGTTIVDTNKDEKSHTTLVNTSKDAVEDSGKGDNPIIEKSTKKMPNTATNTFNFLLIGFVLLFAGGVIYFIRKKSVINQ